MSANKKTLIYKAVLALIEEKHDLGKIKVADVARRADIGKGTIYEYFPSKEDLLMETLVHMAFNDLRDLHDSFTRKTSFKETFYSVIEQIDDIMDKNLSLFRNLVLNECVSFFREDRQAQLKEMLTGIRNSYIEFFYGLVDIGIQEGVFKDRPKKLDLFIAINSTIMLLFLKKEGLAEPKDLESVATKEKAYQVFTKLLY